MKRQKKIGATRRIEMSEICKTCEHYSIDKRGNHGCKKRGQTDGANGYGSFDVGARCFHDLSLLRDLYKPTTEETCKLTSIVEQNDKLFYDLQKAKQDIKALENVIIDMAQRADNK